MHPEKLRYWYHCINCGIDLEPNRPLYKCPNCKKLLMIERDLDFLCSKFPDRRTFIEYFEQPRYPRHLGRRGSGVYQWTDFILPGFPTEYIHSLGEGNTPLWLPPKWLAKEIGLKNMYVKKEGEAPSGSFKDRGMPPTISDTIRLQTEYPDLGIRYIICTSTGDTSASASTYAAAFRDRLRSIVFYASNKISTGQSFQLKDTGAIILEMQGDGFNACLKVVLEFCANHPEIVVVNSANAMRIAGQETISLEIFADLNWLVPAAVVIPIGNGGNATAQMNAWRLLKQLGIIDCLPKIILAQTKGCNTVVRWINSGFTAYEPGQECETLASAMNIQNPVSKPRIDLLHPEFEIFGYDVREEDIALTRARFNQAGAGLCPQGAVAVCAALQARANGVIGEDDEVVVLSTANSLKFTESGNNHHETADETAFATKATVISASVEALEDIVSNLTRS